MIKAIALDVDGVLTDGTFWWDGSGAELKRFSFRDVMGIARASRAGVVFALISGERNAIVDRYAAKMGITHVWQGCTHKDAALQEFSEKIGVPLEEIGFMGDDVNDLSAIAIAGFTATPADAHESVRAVVKLVTKHPAGNGAVREMLDHLDLTGAPHPKPETAS
jgi:3-deoxy-D-manno-octulosonate 8-phosphate phosphatase (KDO 8-P phosphatase)